MNIDWASFIVGAASLFLVQGLLLTIVVVRLASKASKTGSSGLNNVWQRR